MNIAIVGTNFISDRFAAAALATDAITLAAVYSRAESTGRIFAEKYNISKIYTDYSAMISDSEIDAVYIASPTMCHAEQACLAMRSGKHVLCEKMMGATLSDFISMRDTSIATGRVLLEAMRPSHDPAYGRIVSLIPTLGKIRRVTLEFCQYSSRYDRFKDGILTNAFDPTMKNSSLSDIGIYPLHVLLMLFGSPCSYTASSVMLEGGFEGSGAIMAHYGDMIATVIYSKITDSVLPSVIEGELGSLTIDKISAPTTLTLHMRGSEPETIDLGSPANNMIFEIEAFRDMVDGKRDYLPHLDLTERAQRIVEDIYATSHISDHF